MNKDFLRRVLTVILLAVQLTGCQGSTSPPHNVKLVSSPTNETTPIKDPSMIPPLSELNIPAEAKGLSITGDYVCAHSLALQSNVVLAHPPFHQGALMYDSGTLKAIKAYMKTYLFHFGDERAAGNLPLALQSILGATTDGYTPCQGRLYLTNKGSSVLQLSGVEFQLTAVPEPNNYHYNLIDACHAFAIEDARLCYAGGREGQWVANVQLRYGKAKTSFVSKLSHYDPTTGNLINDAHLLLNRNDTAELIVNFSSSGMPNNLIYSGFPELVVDTSGGPQSLQLPPVVLVFAGSSQFSCFELQQDGFVPEMIITSSTTPSQCF